MCRRLQAICALRHLVRNVKKGLYKSAYVRYSRGQLSKYHCERRQEHVKNEWIYSKVRSAIQDSLPPEPFLIMVYDG